MKNPGKTKLDLKNDPGEERNLAGVAEQEGVLAEMRGRWERLGR